MASSAFKPHWEMANLNNYYDVKLKFSRLRILEKYRNFKIQADGLKMPNDTHET